MKKSVLRFRKYVKEERTNGYMVALLDPEGKVVTASCLMDIDELDEHNEWRVNEAAQIIKPKALAGYGLQSHNVRDYAQGNRYSNAEYNEWLKKIKTEGNNS